MFVFAVCFFFVKQKTAYEMRISDWSSDVCSSDLLFPSRQLRAGLIVIAGIVPTHQRRAAELRDTDVVREISVRIEHHVRHRPRDATTHASGGVQQILCRPLFALLVGRHHAEMHFRTGMAVADRRLADRIQIRPVDLALKLHDKRQRRAETSGGDALLPAHRSSTARPDISAAIRAAWYSASCRDCSAAAAICRCCCRHLKYTLTRNPPIDKIGRAHV